MVKFLVRDERFVVYGVYGFSSIISAFLGSTLQHVSTWEIVSMSERLSHRPDGELHQQIRRLRVSFL